MKRAFLAAALVSALGLAACATATPYQPLKTSGLNAGGFSEVKVSSDRYRITFRGNASTDRETVERYLLYRAAERTLADGADYFILTNRATDARSREISRPGAGFNTWEPEWFYMGRGRGRWIMVPRYDPFWSDYDRETITQFQATAEILTGKGRKPANDPAAFDAHEVQANLAPTIQRPAA